MSIPNYTENIAKDMRYFPTLVSVLMFGILALFFKDLSEYLKNYFLPAGLIYTLGTSLIAWVQTMLFIRSGTQLSKKAFGWIIFSHIFWFVLFIAYVMWRLYAK